MHYHYLTFTHEFKPQNAVYKFTLMTPKLVCLNETNDLLS